MKNNYFKYLNEYERQRELLRDYEFKKRIKREALEREALELEHDKYLKNRNKRLFYSYLAITSVITAIGIVLILRISK